VFRRLLDDLQATKAVDLWFDEARIRVGDRFDSAIQTGVKRVDVCLVVLSHRMDASPWLQQEARLAHEIQRGRNTLAVIGLAIDKEFRGEHLRAVPFQVFDLSRDYDRGLEALLEVLTPRPRDAMARFDIVSPVRGSSIIQVSELVGRKLIEHFRRNPAELRRIDRRKFEELVAELFDGFGYVVELTRRTRDGGRDVVAVKHGEVAVKYLIECKRPDPGGYVGVRPVRELYGVKHDEAATKAVLATTAYFSADALLFFDRHKWELEPRDYFGVTEWIDEYLRGDVDSKLRGA
jgi:HJR/Mrr/RecB family endonuclease